MSALFQIWPWYARWLAVLGLVAAVLGYGYTRGYLHEEKKLDIFQAQVDVLAKDAARRAAERRAEQDQTTKEIRDAHQGDIDRIHAYYARKLRDAAGRRPMPAATDRSVKPDGAAGQCGPGDQGAIELEERATLDAAALLEWQDWARRNGFPVR